MSDNFLSQKANCENVKDIQVITQHFGSYILYLSVFRTEMLDLYKGGLRYRRTAGLESRL